MKKKLRLGLLIDNYFISAWAYSMLENIISSNCSEVFLVVKKESDAKNKATQHKNLKKGTTFFYDLYTKLDEKLFKVSPNAFELKDIRAIINCEELTVIPKESNYSDYILDKDIEKIKSQEIDVFIRLGFRILRGEILNSSKYGVWSYHHADNSISRGKTTGALEVFKRWDETGTLLQILNEDLNGGIKLFESYSSTEKLSITRNKNNYYWKSATILPRKLKELYNLGADDFFQKIENYNAAPHFYDKQLYKTPSNFDVLKSVLRIFTGKIKNSIFSKFFFSQWILLYSLEKEKKISTSFFRYKRIMPPKDRFWADPFIIEKNENYFIFMEELLYSENKGKISVIEMDKKGNYSSPQTVLEKDYHLSYPFLFEENGELYMIPETAENNTIELYKCVEFPLKWELSKTIMNNVCAVDTTIFKYNNTYWLFCNVKENKGASSNDELFLFYSDSLFTDNWASHPCNPIVSDVKSARPAGNIFIKNQKIYRPSQNCAKHYGHGMKIHEITELTENSYKEILVKSIYPDWEKDLLSTHTLNNSGRLTIIDALIKRRK